MTAATGKTLAPPLERRSIWRITGRGFWMYVTRLGPFSRVLLLPVLYQLAGAYLAVMLSYWAMDQTVAHPESVFAQHPALMIVMVLVATGTGILLFCKGFWQYLVYFASLNINAAEVMRGRKPDFAAAYRVVSSKTWPYAMYLKVLALVQLLPFLISFCFFMVTGFLPEEARLLFGLFGGVATVASFVPAVVLTVFMGLGFQIVAFEPVTLNGLETAFRSIRMVWGHFWRTLALMLLLFLVTSLAPNMIWGIAEWSGLAAPFHDLNAWLVNMLLANTTPGPDLPLTYRKFHEVLFSMENGNRPRFLSGLISGNVFLYTFTCLMLPLGTFVFTLLYADIQASRQAKPLAKPEEPAVA